MAYLWKAESFLLSWPLFCQVDSLEKLEGVFPGNENSNTDAVDCSCILVRAPEKTDHVYNDLMDVVDGPVVEMPAWFVLTCSLLFYQVSTWNWTPAGIRDTLCRDEQESIVRNQLNAFLFFSEKPNFWPTQGNVLKISYRGKPRPGSHILMIYTKTRGNPRQGSRFGISVYQPPQECRLHSLKSPAKSSSRSSKSRQSKLVVNLKIIVNVFVYISVSIKCCTRANWFCFSLSLHR